MTQDWNISSAIQTYRTDRWGAGYFNINDQGEMEAYPEQDHQSISLPLVMKMAAERGIHSPCLIRFQNILRHRLRAINESFEKAISEIGYQGYYRGVFPIKVNQLREVVEETLDAGKPYHFGIEVGSKPELIIALALHEDPESLLICNGYKDRSFIELALSGVKLNKKTFIVLEKVDELDQIIDCAQRLKMKPILGVRLRLQTKGSGRWALSGGEGAKFGLSTSELMVVIEKLKSIGWEECLKLIHFHVGSQISDINQCAQAVKEGARYYAKLRKMGFQLEYVDIGGGAGIDYDGSRTSTDSSINYTIEEFSTSVVQSLYSICEDEKVPHPAIVSECGRALVAYHSVLVVEAFGTIQKSNGAMTEPGPDADKIVHQIYELSEHFDQENRRATLHQAQNLKEEASTRFGVGLLSLEDKAAVESGFWHLAAQFAEAFSPEESTLPEVIELKEQLGVQYVCNFSVFQSLIDYWALGQLFPICPIHHLNQAPNREASIADITCDSDGKIDHFIGEGAATRRIPLHQGVGAPYWIGFFLMGAYQDVMGDIHNLFGSVPEVHVFLDEDEPEGFYIEEIVPGHSIGDVLEDVQYQPIQLTRQLKKQVDEAIQSDLMRPNEGMALLHQYNEMMKKSTYLTLNGSDHQ
ncbi:MAG: biosynthetic arginine decarboxylase [Verrucomicrobiota bacterium]